MRINALFFKINIWPDLGLFFVFCSLFFVLLNADKHDTLRYMAGADWTDLHGFFVLISDYQCNP